MKTTRALLLLLVVTFTAQAQAQISLIVRTANVHSGQYTDGSSSPAGQATILSAGSVDVVGVQELSISSIGNWDTTFTTAGMTRQVLLANDPGRDDGSAIWTRDSTVSVQSTHTRALTTGVNPTSGLDGIGHDGSTVVRKVAVAVKATKAGRQFFAVSVHLCWSACADSPGSTSSVQRVTQINDLISWINSTRGGLPVVLMGDMNFGPDYPRTGGLQIDLFTTDGYSDLWNTGLGQGRSTAAWGDRDGDSIADMPLGNLTTRTHDTRRIDYIFLKGSGLTLIGIDMPDPRATCPTALTLTGSFKECPSVTQLWDVTDDQGVRASDHNFITATLGIDSIICRFHTLIRCQ